MSRTWRFYVYFERIAILILLTLAVHVFGWLKIFFAILALCLLLVLLLALLVAYWRSLIGPPAFPEAAAVVLDFQMAVEDRHIIYDPQAVRALLVKVIGYSKDIALAYENKALLGGGSSLLRPDFVIRRILDQAAVWQFCSEELERLLAEWDSDSAKPVKPDNNFGN